MELPVRTLWGHVIEFDFGQFVYLKTDSSQCRGIITGIILRPNRGVVYSVSIGRSEAEHYGFELTSEKDVLATM